MVDSGDSDSETDIKVYKSQKSNVSIIYTFLKFILIKVNYNLLYVLRLLKVMKKVHPAVLMVNLINVQYVLLN